METNDEYKEDDNPKDNLLINYISPKKIQRSIFNKEYRSMINKRSSEKEYQESMCAHNQVSMPNIKQESNRDQTTKPMENSGFSFMKNQRFPTMRDQEFPFKGYQLFPFIGNQGFMPNRNEEYSSIKKQKFASTESEESLSPRSPNSGSITKSEEISSISNYHPQMPIVSKELIVLKEMCKQKNDPIRNQFLTRLCDFMAKRGKPISQMPTIAKSTLDLYDLYREVIRHGGLIEVINQNRWYNVIKNIHLPTNVISIISKLREQYIRYLYEYECENFNLSSKDQLIEAIESIRQESSSANKNENLVNFNAEEEEMKIFSPELKEILESIKTSKLKETQTPIYELERLKFNGSSPCTQLSHNPQQFAQESNPLLTSDLMPSNFDPCVIDCPSIMNEKSNKNDTAKVLSPQGLSSIIKTLENHGSFLTMPFEERYTHFNEHSPTDNGTSCTTPSSSSKSILDMQLDSERQTEILRLKSLSPTNSLSSRSSISSSTSSDIPSISNDDIETSSPQKKHLYDNNYSVERSLVTSMPTRIDIHCESVETGTVYVFLDLQGITYEGILYATNNTTRTLTTSINNENDITSQRLMQ